MEWYSSAMESYWKETLITIAPFVLLLVLWLIIAKRIRPFFTRGNVPADVTAELHTLRESIDALRTEVKVSNDRRGD